MLLGYGARNCWCFKDWMEIDMEFSENVPSDISMNLPAATAMCFKGANASGKTNALKVVSFLADFAKNSYDYPTDAKIMFDPFFYNDEPAEFFVDFLVDSIRYKYELIVTREKVIQEKLYRKISRDTLVFQRDENKITKNTFFSLKKNYEFKRKNASFISIFERDGGIEEIKPIYDFFYRFNTNVNYGGWNSLSLANDLNSLCQIYLNDPSMLNFTKTLIKKFDTGIESIQIGKRQNEKNEIEYYPIFVHKLANDEERNLVFDFESSGTQSLFNQLALYFYTMQQGGILALDEFDIHLHPEILPHLLYLFINKDMNKNNAQLIITTHSSDVMDMLGRYRTYLFQKLDGESICYRVDEINNATRNDRLISVPYKKHLLGGVPKIEDEE